MLPLSLDSVYAGKIDERTMLIISEEEMGEAYLREVGVCGPTMISGYYNPNNAGLKTENVDYWLPSA